MQIEHGRSLRGMNTLRLDARAERYVRVDSVDALREALALAGQHGWTAHVLGGGSNSVVCADVAGLLIHVALAGHERLAEDGEHCWLRVAAGENWPDWVDKCLANGWHGLENLALIPGWAGAAPVQNIGAYGVELSRCLVAVQALDRHSGELLSISAADCRLRYRDSAFKRELAGQFAICALDLKLEKRASPCLGHPALRAALADIEPTPRAVRDAVVRLRRARLPDPAKTPNAGSFFRNPLLSEAHYRRLLARWPDLPGRRCVGGVRIPAAWLLSADGWPGRSRGRVAVSERHALVLVNLGGANGADVLALAATIQRSVRRRFGVVLAREPCMIGEPHAAAFPLAAGGAA